MSDAGYLLSIHFFAIFALHFSLLVATHVALTLQHPLQRVHPERYQKDFPVSDDNKMELSTSHPAAERAGR